MNGTHNVPRCFPFVPQDLQRLEPMRYTVDEFLIGTLHNFEIDKTPFVVNCENLRLRLVIEHTVALMHMSHEYFWADLKNREHPFEFRLNTGYTYRIGTGGDPDVVDVIANTQEFTVYLPSTDYWHRLSLGWLLTPPATENAEGFIGHITDHPLTIQESTRSYDMVPIAVNYPSLPEIGDEN